jgi:hypothetical protein
MSDFTILLLCAHEELFLPHHLDRSTDSVPTILLTKFESDIINFSREEAQVITTWCGNLIFGKDGV